MLRFLVALLFAITGSASVAVGREISIATWNLGWHMDVGSVDEWIRACTATYEENKDTKTFKASIQPGSQFGWDIDVFAVDGWDVARLPVCDVYAAVKQGFGFSAIRVTHAAYEKRRTQIVNFIKTQLPADIIAFQEVSGKQAVLDVLPGGQEEWAVCSFTEFKVQRLAIAYRKSLGTELSCAAEAALSLKNVRPPKEQPRPGLMLALDVDGNRLQILNVHLKSGCVSAIGGDPLAGKDDACEILHDQVIPLETWLEREAAVSDNTILIGDFNRNFWHELKDTRPVRSDSSDPTSPLPLGVRVNSLFEEINDGQPVASAMTMLKEQCPLNEIGKLLCEWSETRALVTPEVDVLRHSDYLGCRNPIGLDHVLVGPGLTARGDAKHIGIGRLGGSKHPNEGNPEPLLSIADHCPMIATVALD